MKKPDFCLDRRSTLPLHSQIEGYLRSLLEQPPFRDGALLPREEALATKLGVSRNTVRAAMSRLLYEGLIERRPGHGTRVVPKGTQTALTEWHSFSEEMRARGIEVVNYSLKAEKTACTSDEAAGLGLDAGTEVVRITRVRGWDNTPVVLSISTLHPRLGVRETDDWSGRLYETIAKATQVDAVRSSELISATLASPEVARQLGIAPKSPVLHRRRMTYDFQREPIEYNLNWYRAEHHALRLELSRGGPDQ